MRCSSFDRLRKSFTILNPLSTRWRSHSLISRYRRSQTSLPLASLGSRCRFRFSGWTRTTSTSS